MSALNTKYSIRNTSAYTLIEILVALTIIGILFGAGYASFRDFARRQSILDATKKIQADLRLAQGIALAGQLPADAKCTGTNDLNGYFFDVLGANHYEIRASCTGGNAANATKDVILPADITIVNPMPVPDPILFKVLGNGTNIGGATATINIKQLGTSATATVTISAGGQIQ